MAEEQTNGTDAGNELETGNDPGQENGNEVTFSEAQQAKINEIVADRLARAEKKFKEQAEKAKAKAEEEAERTRLKEQAKWQELAEQHEAALEEIKPKYESASEKLERYESALSSYLEAARDGVPEYVTELLDRLDPVDQLQWLTDHTDELAKPRAPSLNAGQGSDEEPPKTLTEERKKFIADAMGVNPQYIPDDLLEEM